MRFGPYTVDISHRDKVYFPGDGISKGRVLDYYRKIAPVFLRHARRRPLTLHRFPDGIGEDGFYQQQASDHFPGWLDTCEVPRADDGGEPVNHALANNQASLVYLANQGVIAFHGWLSRAPELRCPDRLVFDLDPPGDDPQAVFDGLVEAARYLREALQACGLHPFVMTTGSRGLHVVAPLRPTHGFDAVRGFARRVAERLAEEHPDSLTVAQRKAKRGERIYLDVMRNAYGQTGVLPYTLRAKPGAPVATPLDWDELGREGMHAQRWNIGNVLRRLGQRDDPWAGMSRRARTPNRAIRALEDAAD